MKRDKGQMELSFGMIFSIILIIVFIAFAFYAIYKFLGIQDSAKIGLFKNDLQSDVDKMWRSSQGSQEVEYSLPLKVKEICFVNEDENLILNSGSEEFIKIIERYNITHINVVEMTDENSELCIENIKGQVKMIIKKNYGENFVLIEKSE